MSTRPVNATEASILERLCANGRCTITWRYGVGPRGGRIRGGDRERIAADRLVEAGVAKVVERGRYRADFGGTAYVILKGVQNDPA